VTVSHEGVFSSRLKPQRQRTLSRALHLVGAGLIGTFVYAPPSVSAGMQPVIAFVVIPVLAVSGLFIWQQARITRFLRKPPRTR
jgi:hypothetical protein